MGQEAPVFLSQELVAAYIEKARQLGFAAAAAKHPPGSLTASDGWIAQELHRWAPRHAEEVCARQPRHKKRKDAGITGAASAASAVMPFSGILIGVPYILHECISYMKALGLIGKAVDQDTIEKSFKLHYDQRRRGTSSTVPVKEGVMQAAEGAALDVLKTVAGDWVESVVADLLAALVFELASETVSIVPGAALLFWPAKYALMRHQIKHFRKKMGRKSLERHQHWVAQNEAMLLQEAAAWATGYRGYGPGQSGMPANGVTTS